VLKAIPAVTLEQIRKFHKDYFGPSHMTLVVVGDVKANAVNAQVAHSFKGWAGGVDYLRAHDAIGPQVASLPPIKMVDKASVSVAWGQPTGLRFDDADYLPLALGVGVLGSGFTSRLMSAVRAREGLTYGISANLFGSDMTTGGFLISTTFAPELLDKGVASTQRELSTWWKEGITEAELAARKKNLAGGYQVRLGSTVGMAAAMIGTVKRGVDLGWLDRYPAQIQATPLASVNAAIRKHTDPAKLLEVRAGTFNSK
jgi:zinc protease